MSATSQIVPIINAAGKLTALGGSAQSDAVAAAQAAAARLHVDMSLLRQQAAQKIADLTGAESACITSGAAAGISIAVASIITGSNLDRSHRLPHSQTENFVLIQAGHVINFGAPVEQMIRLGGGMPWIVGSSNNVSERILIDSLENEEFAAMLYVQSHHCVQTNQVGLKRCIEICHRYEIPVIVDAAAEEDLRFYVDANADLVIYSGGKAFCGPTSGFIVGRAELISACEMQFQGIARTMKVGKETIAGLLAALAQYEDGSASERSQGYETLNDQLMHRIANCKSLNIRRQPDEVGRSFSRVAISLVNPGKNIRSLVEFLGKTNPSIRTRNHHLDEGYLLIDPRELTRAQVDIIADRLEQFVV